MLTMLLLLLALVRRTRGAYSTRIYTVMQREFSKNIFFTNILVIPLYTTKLDDKLTTFRVYDMTDRMKIQQHQIRKSTDTMPY